MERVDNKIDIEQWVRPNVLRMRPYSSARDEFKDFQQDYVFLDANENPYNSAVNRYPDPQQRALKQLLANQKKVQEGQILLGNGSDEVLDLIMRVFCEPGQDDIIIVPPTYGMYKVLGETNNINVIEVPLSKDFQPNVPQILDAQTQNTKLLFLCSPNNPTGNTIAEELIIQLLEGFSGIVVIDEAYIDFSDKRSWVHRISDHGNLIVTQTLSKAYGMAGIRLGVCYASSEVISYLNKIKPPYNINSLTQDYAYQCLMDNANFEREISSILFERKRLSKALESNLMVQELFPSDANFILVRVDDANKRYQQLLNHGIVVRKRNELLHCENTLRITIGTPKENDMIINVLNKLQS